MNKMDAACGTNKKVVYGRADEPSPVPVTLEDFEDEAIVFDEEPSLGG